MVVRPRPLAEGMRESSCVGVKISPSLGHSRLQALGRGFIVVRSCRCHRTVSVGLRRILARAAGINWRKPNVKNQGAPEIEAAVMGAGHREAAVGPSAGGRVSTAMRTSARPANGGRMDGDRARGPKRRSRLGSDERRRLRRMATGPSRRWASIRPFAFYRGEYRVR